MELFGHPELRDELAGTKVRRLANVLTLDSDCRVSFDNLWLWLEASQNEIC
jgi:hypothetical protein